MKVSELGEFGLIDLLARLVSSSRDAQAPSWQRLLIGIGDDAAAWQGNNSVQLATVDSLVQDVHFSLGITPWYDLGWKSLAVNLSDIAAMGGVPRYALVALTLPGSVEVEDIVTMYRGMIELARKWEVAIVGGNVSNAPLISITITVLGIMRNQNRMLTRSSARPGEQIAVTGYLGAAAAGLEMLDKRLQFDPESASQLKAAFLRPQPRINEGELLVKHGIRTAIDISDGLVSDLNHVCQASQVGACIDIDRVPVAPAARASFGDKSLNFALSGGEDYELLFTGSAEAVASVKKAASCPITVIGETNDTGRIALIDSSGSPFVLDRAGWEHFK